MRRDVLLLAAICCSLLDRCAAGRMRLRKEGQAMGWGTPKIARRLASQRCFANCGEF